MLIPPCPRPDPSPRRAAENCLTHAFAGKTSVFRRDNVCGSCYCFVCDTPVAECVDWTKHCNACNQPSWVHMRTQHRAAKTAAKTAKGNAARQAAARAQRQALQQQEAAARAQRQAVARQQQEEWARRRLEARRAPPLCHRVAVESNCFGPSFRGWCAAADSGRSRGGAAGGEAADRAAGQ